MTDFTMSVDADGVATIVWDVKTKSMNVLQLVQDGGSRLVDRAVGLDQTGRQLRRALARTQVGDVGGALQDGGSIGRRVSRALGDGRLRGGSGLSRSSGTGGVQIVVETRHVSSLLSRDSG